MSVELRNDQTIICPCPNLMIGGDILKGNPALTFVVLLGALLNLFHTLTNGMEQAQLLCVKHELCFA